MTAKSKNYKKVASRKKLGKKEIEIPIYVVSRLEENDEIKTEPTKESVQSEVICQMPSKTTPNFADSQKEKAEFSSFKKEVVAPAFKLKIENLPIGKKKILMWVLVVFLTGFIFFGWLFMLKHSLITSKTNPSLFTRIGQDLVEVPDLWQNYFNPGFSGSKKILSEEEINKLKEKVLEAANAKDTENQNELNNTNEIAR